MDITDNSVCCAIFISISFDKVNVTVSAAKAPRKAQTSQLVLAVSSEH